MGITRHGLPRHPAHRPPGPGRHLTGNLLISLIRGLLRYVVLLILGVPFAALIALFVGIADLIPLVGATSGRSS